MAEIRAASAAGRPETVHIFADLVVFLDATAAGPPAARPGWTTAPADEYASDAAVFTGTPAQLAG